MEGFFPFIHKIKKENELQPLYVELYPPLEEEQKEQEQEQEQEQENSEIIIIEL